MIQFQRDVPLRSHNSFGVAATALRYAHVRTEDELSEWCVRHGSEAPLLLGGGSNVLLTRDPVAPVFDLEPRGIQVIRDDGDTVLLEAMAGEPWHGLVQWTLAQGLCGLENLSLIPGRVGAAPVQNIGAYGVEMASRCESVAAIDLHTGEPVQFGAAECNFGYRESRFKHALREHGHDRYAITRVRFRLSRRFQPHLDYGDIKTELQARRISAPSAQDVARAVIAIRERKLPDPAVIGNAGSFFKNPVVPNVIADALSERFPGMPRFAVAGASHQSKLAAGWLIDRAGWKGRRLREDSAAAVHAQHALVLVNHGGASGADILELANAIADDVARQFGVALEVEPRIV
ncbi:MAG: UDP-N-acetylmuramate dehydrogenase [Burkholderiales bacterium]|nr:UDP-N-acetylmuramate dehydrogenase [Burkholderiales bacterium]